jgi:hypothetical protein
MNVGLGPLEDRLLLPMDALNVERAAHDAHQPDRRNDISHPTHRRAPSSEPREPRAVRPVEETG